MSQPSVPTPIKILLALSLAIMAWILIRPSFSVDDSSSSINGDSVQAVIGDQAVQPETDSKKADADSSVLRRDEMPPAMASRETAKLQARYINSANQPIGNATIELWHLSKIGMGIAQELPQNKQPDAVAHSDANGFFEIPLIKLPSVLPAAAIKNNGDEYVLVLRHPDYVDKRVLSMFEFDQWMVVIASKSRPNINLQIERSDGEPAAVAGVFVDGQLVTWSNASGKCAFNLSDNSSEVYIRHDSGALALSSSNMPSKVMIPPAFSISGTTTSPSGEALSGVRVKASRLSQQQTTGNPIGYGISDSNGQFTIKGLAEGEYQMSCVVPLTELEKAVTAITGTDDVHIKLGHFVFGLTLVNAPKHPAWFRKSIVGIGQDGAKSQLMLEQSIGLIEPDLTFYIPRTSNLSQLQIEIEVAGYKRVQHTIALNETHGPRSQEIVLEPDSLQASARFVFKMPRDLKPFELKFKLVKQNQDTVA
ncbi:MAG: carboxypeptidase-like regulatory domain-containing protein, partial [Planctomycetota bacterium]|nr:carboxypeptidase-like regulatory domain-containing protein [Planctomycetota bacterium]